jgi:hypothetical protein
MTHSYKSKNPNHSIKALGSIKALDILVALELCEPFNTIAGNFFAKHELLQPIVHYTLSLHEDQNNSPCNVRLFCGHFVATRIVKLWADMRTVGI